MPDYDQAQTDREFDRLMSREQAYPTGRILPPIVREIGKWVLITAGALTVGGLALLGLITVLVDHF